MKFKNALLDLGYVLIALEGAPRWLLEAQKISNYNFYPIYVNNYSSSVSRRTLCEKLEYWKPIGMYILPLLLPLPFANSKNLSDNA